MSPIGFHPTLLEIAMVSLQNVPTANRLLANLPRKDREHFLAGCDEVDLVLDDILSEPGERLRYVYFPTGSIISLLTPVLENEVLEVGLVGNEGMFGASLVLGVNASSFRGLVQGAGSAWRMEAAPFRRELDSSPALQRVLRRYVYVVVSQLAQTSACTRFHLVEARLARWLLMTHDRAHSDQLHVTHEFLSYMLGVRRVGITKAATALQNRKLIRYSRGEVTILDRSGMRAAACLCYEADKATYNRIMC
ncbi:MAG: Crp/Fnr family transcriptional regulator [Burkholderiales bacterium]